jgi:hypothetical protein
MKPIVCLMKLADGDAPCTGKIYYKCFQVQQQLGDEQLELPDDVREKVLEIWQARWTYLHSPIHGAAYCLDPEYWDDEAEGNVETFNDLLLVINKIHTTPADRQAARQQYAAYKAKELSFGRMEAAYDAPSLPSHQWWELYGKCAPQLLKVAVRILSQVGAQ